MSAPDPMYQAGLKAGLEIAAAFVTGRADMATELRHHAVAGALTSAARGILTLTPSDQLSEADHG